MVTMSSLNVRPTFSFLDECNHLSGYTVSFSYRLKSSTGFTNFYNIFIREFCIWMPFSTSIRTSTFTDHVSDIVSWCSQKKMFWIYTWGIITSMANVHSLWNWTIFTHPHKSVGMLSAFPLKHSIAVCKSTCCPNPARFSFFNLNKKSFPVFIRHDTEVPR